MTTRVTWVLVAAVAVAAAAIAGRAAAVPQAGSATARLELPRTAGGTPDLSGIWQVMNTANWNILPHAASLDSPGGLGVVVGEDDLPYLPSALGRREENHRSRLTADTDARCFLPGVPRIMYEPYPFQIFHTPDGIVMAFQYRHAMRNIFMNTPHPKGPIQWWMGDSRGRWEGDTLVVDVVHFTGETWFDRAGNYHSEDLHVVERYTLMDRDHIQYEATIEDPRVFSRPWDVRMIFYRHREPHFRLLEHECLAFGDEAAGNLVQPVPR